MSRVRAVDICGAISRGSCRLRDGRVVSESVITQQSVLQSSQSGSARRSPPLCGLIRSLRCSARSPFRYRLRLRDWRLPIGRWPMADCRFSATFTTGQLPSSFMREPRGPFSRRRARNSRGSSDRPPSTIDTITPVVLWTTSTIQGTSTLAAASWAPHLQTLTAC